MYHISRDKRAAQSAELIYDGLLQCLAHKPFDHITVTDVQRASGVARTTIYRCFDNLSDILYWRCDLCFREALRFGEPNDAPDEWQLIQSFFSYWTEHSDILKLLIDINRQDIIYACHMKNAQALERVYGTLPGLDGTTRRYFMALRTGVTVSMLKAWLDGGRRESAQELIDILRHQLVILSSGIL